MRWIKRNKGGYSTQERRAQWQENLRPRQKAKSVQGAGVLRIKIIVGDQLFLKRLIIRPIMRQNRLSWAQNKKERFWRSWTMSPISRSPLLWLKHGKHKALGINNRIISIIGHALFCIALKILWQGWRIIRISAIPNLELCKRKRKSRRYRSVHSNL